MHDRVVERRIEGPAQGFDLLHAQLLHRRVELGHDHLDALAVGLVLGGLLQRPDEVVVHRQELQKRVGLDVGVQAVLLALAALAVVVILGQQSQICVRLGLRGLGLFVLLRRGLFFLFLLGLFLFGLFLFLFLRRPGLFFGLRFGFFLYDFLVLLLVTHR